MKENSMAGISSGETMILGAGQSTASTVVIDGNGNILPIVVTDSLPILIGNIDDFWANVAASGTVSTIVEALNYNANIAVLLYAKKPVVLYETDGTTGLLGVNNNTMSDSAWQLTNLDLSPFSSIKCYFKQSDLKIASNNYLAPSVIVEVPLNQATKSRGSDVCPMYLGAQTTLLPDNRNRFYNVVVAVDSTKTKLQVAYQTYLWDVSTSDANTDGKYLWKIEGWY